MIRDVKIYYYNMLSQYLEMKQDLKDFEEALAAGHITEDQLEEAKADVAQIEQNYNRLTYIMFLLEVPSKKDKKEKFYKVNKTLMKAFEELGADAKSVEDENTSALLHLRAELKKLKEKEKK